MITFTIDKKDVARIQDKLRRVSFKDRDEVLKKSMQRAGLLLERNLKLNISGKILKVRSGRLRNSIGSRVNQGGDNIELIVGSGVRQGNRVSYANIHETGGTVRPTNGQYLTVPLRAAKTASGVVKGRARDFRNTFIIKAHGNLFIVQKVGKSLVWLFILKKQVTVPPRKYMSRTLEESKEQVVQEVLNAINKVLNES